MPWSTPTVPDLRTALIHAVRTAGRPVAHAGREFGVSRKTAHKWLARYGADPAAGRPVPPATHLAHPPRPPQRFEWPAPNDLWQVDFEGSAEVGRQKVFPRTVLDDHSRCPLAADPCTDQTMATARAVRWRVFGEVGLPAAVRCDNAFGTRRPDLPPVSGFDPQLVRLGVRPVHGRAYHPQTPGQVERVHGTPVREVWPTVRRDTLDHFAADLGRWRAEVYNPVRPHEALGVRPPATRWRASPRPRPAAVPGVEYPPGATVREVAGGGDIARHTARILVGGGPAGERVRVGGGRRGGRRAVRRPPDPAGAGGAPPPRWYAVRVTHVPAHRVTHVPALNKADTWRPTDAAPRPLPPRRASGM